MDRRTKRKIIKAAVELRVKGPNGFEHIGYYGSKMEAEHVAKKSYRDREYRTFTVRVDATPIPGTTSRSE
jgi:hypothetical protein